jgi:hypothetical protein
MRTMGWPTVLTQGGVWFETMLASDWRQAWDAAEKNICPRALE